LYLQNPVPSNGGNNLDIPCGPLDQAATDLRADVIVFTSPVFDHELPMTGPLFADIYVSSDAIDTDFMVKIEDLYPTGEARLLQDSAVRMRWREGGLTPLWMEKGAVYPAHLSLWNTSYVLAPGHALRVAITSSNTPRFDINRNNGHLLADADKGDFITATNTIYHSAQYPSSITLPIVKKTDIPETHLIEEFKKVAPAGMDVDATIAKLSDRISKMMINGAAKRKAIRGKK
jgi:putative CocE/NonD family hydrolase